MWSLGFRFDVVEDTWRWVGPDEIRAGDSDEIRARGCWIMDRRLCMPISPGTQGEQLSMSKTTVRAQRIRRWPWMISKGAALDDPLICQSRGPVPFAARRSAMSPSLMAMPLCRSGATR